MKKPTIAALMRELDALKKQVAELEARPAQSVEHHYHYPQQPTFYPQPYRWPTYWGTTLTSTSPTYTVWNSDEATTATLTVAA